MISLKLLEENGLIGMHSISVGYSVIKLGRKAMNGVVSQDSVSLPQHRKQSLVCCWNKEFIFTYAQVVHIIIKCHVFKKNSV